MTTTPTRYFELDLLRTIAILSMVTYHTAFDLWYFYDWNIPIYDGSHPLAIPRNFSHISWWLFGRGTATLFLLLVGISFVISWNHHSKKPMRHLKRGFLIFSCGMLVTIATYFFDPETYVRFGILHLIGASIMLLPHCTKLRKLHFCLAITIILLGNIITGTTVATSLLLPLGFTPSNFTTIDYFPLLPWFGIVLLGTSIGQLLYVQNLTWRSKISSIRYPLSIIHFISRSSLWIYLFHQPIIFTTLHLLLGLPIR